MQCWVTVKVTCRKHPIFEWRGTGGVWIVLFPEVATFENSVSKMFWSPKRIVAWATSLKNAVLQGQEFLPLPFSTPPHPTACSQTPQPQNDRYATFLRSLIRTGLPSVSPTHPTHQLVSSSTTSKWPTGYLPPLPYTDRGLPHSPLPTLPHHLLSNYAPLKWPMCHLPQESSLHGQGYPPTPLPTLPDHPLSNYASRT